MTTTRPITEIEFSELLYLEPHGPDTYVGIAADYPWRGRLYGGQVIAQALRAAIHTVDVERTTHSLHSYFIRPGSPNEPIRFEVERLRDGRSFCTRQVVARQSSGAILNLSASFQVDEDEADVTLAEIPEELPGPDEPTLRDDSWGGMLERRPVDLPGGRFGNWIRIVGDLDDDPVTHVCGMAFMSDGAPFRAGRSAHPDVVDGDHDREQFAGASLDHSMWFHRPSRADQWHWFDMRSHGLAGGRGLAIGDVLTIDGVHSTTVAQEILLRRNRSWTGRG